MRIVADAFQLKDTLLLLDRLVHTFPEIADDFFSLLELDAHIIEVDLDDTATASAGDLRVLLKPSDRLVSFMTALRTGYG